MSTIEARILRLEQMAGLVPVVKDLLCFQALRASGENVETAERIAVRAAIDQEFESNMELAQRQAVQSRFV
jgi:hypothetical protein